MNSNNFFQLVAEFQQNVNWLNQILLGGSNDSVMIDGVSKPSISKDIATRWNAISAMVQGRAAYQLKSQLPSTPPSGVVLAEVWNDPTISNNGLYGWTGSAWQKSPFDPQTEFTRRVATGRWQVTVPNPDNTDANTYELNFSSKGSGGLAIFTVNWSTMRILDGIKSSVRKVADQPDFQIPHNDCLYINTREDYIDDGSNDGLQGYQIQHGQLSSLGASFVSGDNLLLIGNYYGIPMGLLASDMRLFDVVKLFGTNDGKGQVFPRLSDAESRLDYVEKEIQPTLSFDVPGYSGASHLETDEADSLFYMVDQWGWSHFNTPEINAPSFASSFDDSLFTILDESGNTIQEIDHFGGVSSPGARYWPLPYVSGSQLRVTGHNGDQLVSDFGDNQILSTFPFNSKSIRAVVDKPGLHQTTQVSGAPDCGVLVPDDQRVLHVCIIYGQSLSVGAQGQPLVSTVNPCPNDALMFAGDSKTDIRMGLATLSSELEVLDPSTLTGFQPLIAKTGQGNGNRGETVGEALAFELSSAARKVGAPWKSLWIAPGLGGTNYQGLKKGTQPYQNMLTAISRAKELAEGMELKVVVDFVYIVHGEADSGNSNYYDNLIQWQSDIDTDVKTITHQSADIPFFMTQPSSFFGGSEAVDAFLKAHETSDKHFLVTPNYPYPYSPDILHLSGPGYHLVSEVSYLAFAWQNWPGKGWDCLRIKSASRSGSKVVLTYNVPVPPLVIDTNSVSERDFKGFRYKDSTGFIDITDVKITNSGLNGTGNVEVTLATEPQGTGETIEYAMNGHSGGRSVETIPRGNIRDSAGTDRKSNYDARRLDNWAVHQSVAVIIDGEV